MKKILLLGSFMLMLGGLAFGQAQRKALVEEFTGASCPPCATQNPGFNALLMQNHDKIIGLKYQINIPGFDPFYNQNTTDVNSRRDYYGANSAPSSWLDGFEPGDDYGGGIGAWDVAGGGYAGGPYGYNQAVIDYAAAQTTPIEVDVTHSLSSDLTTIDISVTITNVSADEFNLADGKLRVALIEEFLEFPTSAGSNGETEFEGMMRDMYPTADGTALTAIPAGMTATFTFSETLPDYIYRYDEIGVVAFVQDDSDKAIYQAELSEPIELTGFADAGLASLTQAPTELCGASITPSVAVSNEGTNEITSFDVSYTVNGGTPVVENWTGTLMTGASETFNFPEIMLPGGTTTVEYTVENVNGSLDINSINNGIAPDVFSSLSDTPIGTALVEGNENYEEFTFPTIGIVAEPIPDGTFGSGSFRVVQRSTLSATAGDPIGGYGESDQSIWINFYQWNPALATSAAEGTITYDKIDLSDQINAKFFFDRAAAEYTGGSGDGIQVLVSTDCAATWTVVHDIAGSDLATAGQVDPLYLPAANEWTTDTIDLSAYNGNADVNIQIKAISAWGNCAYLDNFNLVGQTSVNATEVNLLEGKVAVFPNPTAANVPANIEFELANATNVDIRVYDVVGKLVTVLEDNTAFSAGKFVRTWKDAPNAGLYVVKITTEQGQITKHITVQ